MLRLLKVRSFRALSRAKLQSFAPVLWDPY